MQQRGDAADDFKSQKSRQHKNVKVCDKTLWHGALLHFNNLVLRETGRPSQAAAQPAVLTEKPSALSAGSEKNSRTRAWTTCPPCVIIVSRVISSSRASSGFPPLNRCVRNVLIFRAYIWLAW